jgi:hypothetical protein
MKRIIVSAQLALAAALYPALAAAADPPCPIEQVVGQIQLIKGDRRVVHLHRNGQEVLLTSEHMCLLYGDKLKADLQATVIIDTAKGPLHIGGNYNSEWEAPEPRGMASPNVSVALNTLFHSLFGPAQHQSAYATARGSDACPPPQHALPPLAPLNRLRQMDQQIGADLRILVAAWTPSREPRDVQARLLGADGLSVVEDRTCLETHVVLPLRAGLLHPGNRLALELTDNYGGLLRYNLFVVEPNKLPQPPFQFQDDWELGAWRIAAAPQESHLDAIARLQTAPGDALGAQRILEAVWMSAPF